MKTNISSAILLLVARAVTAHTGDHILHCDELADTNATSFEVVTDTGTITTSCEWVDARDTTWRCNEYPSIKDHCPVTCNVDCLSGSPSASPSLAPSEAIECKYRVNNPEPFPVEGNSKNRTCEWADRRDTRYRCESEEVKWNCQVVCNLDCVIHETQAPSISPELPVFGKAIDGNIKTKKTFPYDIVFGALGGALLIGTVAFAVRAKTARGQDLFERPPSDDGVNNNFNEVQFDTVEETNDEGYSSSFFGWGRRPTSPPEPQPEPILEPVDEETEYIEPVRKQTGSNNWKRRQY